jgi:hypothetical protein
VIWCILLFCFLVGDGVLAQTEKRPRYASFEYEVARAHEIKPHRRNIPHEGIRRGFHQLQLTLTVSPSGEVLTADAGGDSEALKFWPEVQNEVRRWRFVPFEKDGTAVTAEVYEYIDFVPPERLPKSHVTPPAIRSDSRISITLERGGCLGSCPSYKVTVSTDSVVFDGVLNVVARGTHVDTIEGDEVRKFAGRFVAADFYSMAENYSASATDLPTFRLSIEIDGSQKQVVDYLGEWVGMPAVITELEEATDTIAHTQRWIEGEVGLVRALEAERYDFKTYNAQVVLKAAASRGATVTVSELLKAGVPLRRLPIPKPPEPFTAIPLASVGWLTAASSHPDTLLVLIKAAASKNDQSDKDVALAKAAKAGSLDATRALIAYGANPNAPGAGSVLIYAAASGKPEMVREILRYNPNLEARDRTGQTALFAAGDWREGDEDGARVECVRLLAKAGADVNARDNEGNTPLHETFLTDVEEELLKLGADVNARNKDGETPIFTTVDDEAIPLFIKHGANLTIRNKKGETVAEAAKVHGPRRQEVLRKAIQEAGGH